MASLVEIANGLADTLGTIVGLRVTPYVPESINPPCAFVYLSDVTEDTFGYGSMGVGFEAVFLTSRSSARIGQGSLLEYADTSGVKSVWTALAANDDLGLGDGTQATIVRFRSLSAEEIAAYTYYGGVFEIRVTTPG